MNCRNKIKQVPLDTINQSPGNEESFIYTSDQSKTLSTSLEFDANPNEPPKYKEKSNQSTKQIDEGQDQNEQQQTEKRKSQNEQQQVKKGKKGKNRNKRTKDTEYQQEPKIYIGSKILQQDLTLLKQHAEQTLKQTIKQLREMGWIEQQIQIYKQIIQQSNKQTFDKIMRNIVVTPSIYSDDIVPIEIQLTKTTQKINQINCENLKIGCDRIRKHSSKLKPMIFMPKLPQIVDIIFADGSYMPANDFLKELSQTPEIEEAKQMVKNLEDYCHITQKKFIETVDLNRKARDQVYLVLNRPKNEKRKSVIRKINFN